MAPRRFITRDQAPWWFRAAFWLLAKLTRRQFDDFATTIGWTTYLPVAFDTWSSVEQGGLLVHESAHAFQFVSWPIYRLRNTRLWRLNAAMMGAAYLLVPRMRRRFEQEAYAAQIESLARCGHFENPLARIRFAMFVGTSLGGAAYGWCWTYQEALDWTIAEIERAAGPLADATPDARPA